MASAAITYSASSVGISPISLALNYVGSGAASGQTTFTVTRPIYTPPAQYLTGINPVLRRWIQDVSKLLNDGVEGQEVITSVRNSGAEINTAVIEAKAAADVANAAAASASESAQVVETEVVVVQEQIAELETRVRALEP